MLAEICTKPVVTVGPEATIKEAARLMRTKNVGAVVVVNRNKPVGIVTDRDIAMAAVADGHDPTSATVQDVMRTNPTVIREDQGVFDAVKMLGARGVRRLPVVDRGGKLTGIVALDDLLILLGNEMGQVSAALTRSLKSAAAGRA